MSTTSGADDGAEMVWVRTNRNGGSNDVYHTDPDCQNLQQAENVNTWPRSSVSGGRRECTICQGQHPQGGEGDWTMQRALLEASRGREATVRDVEGSAETHRCEDCGKRVTVGPSGTEYGHSRYKSRKEGVTRCPQRPDKVDPDKPGRTGLEVFQS